MLRAFALALAQLFDRRILGVLVVCALLSVACFAALWAGIGWLLAHSSLVQIGWVDTILDVLGGVATLALTWLGFPLVISVFVGLFLERVAAAVEARHYPDLGPPPGLPWWQAMANSLRFLVVVLALNALLLVLLLAGPVYPVAYLGLNGFLLGREYFELVALRRLTPQAGRELRRAHGVELLVLGAAITALLAVPLLNLVVPVVATATIVHRFEAWRRAAPGQAAGGG